MQYRMIQRIFGVLLMVFSLSLLPPIGVSLWYGDGEADHFLLSMACMLATGFLLWLPVRNHHRELRTRDGFLIVTLFWAVLGMFSALPFMLGPHLDFSDATFEAVSGFTTTGATVLSGLDEMPHSLLYYRQQLQWLGGMGIIVLAVAVLPMLGVGGMQLYRAETPGPVKDDKLTPRITHTARALWYIYVGLTAACAFAYWLAGMTPFDAIGHSFATIATGGFSTHDASLGYFNSPLIEMIAVVFMLLGAINFAVHFTVWHRRRPRQYLADSESRAFLLFITGFTLLFAGILYGTGTYHSLIDALRYGLFQVASIMTTTGFLTTDYTTWPLFLPILLMLIPFIGGCAGSTGGGMKVVRILLMIKQGLREGERLVHPAAVIPVKFDGKPVSERVLESIWGFFSLYILSTLILTLLMMSTGLDALEAFAAISTCLNVTGPGLGEVTMTFATVTDFGKWVSIFAMLLGRLEVFTLFVLLLPSFWRR